MSNQTVVQTDPTSSNTSGSTPARLLSDPGLTTCPDFSSAAFQAIRLAQQDIDRLKVQWAAQVEADKRTQEAEDARLQDEADQAAADAAKIAEEERLEAEKKKPKLGDCDVTSAPPSFVESPISAFAQRKLERREYCPLWPFTPAGLKETAEARLSNDDISALKLSRDADNQLTVPSGPSSSAHKNMVRDEHLTWRQFSLGNIRYIKEIVRADWPRAHVEALTQFFYILDQHDLHNLETDGENIIKIYADRLRAEWFRTLGTSQSFNIAIIEEKIMAKISDEYFGKRRAKLISETTQAL
ncbi:hypothetical protein B0H13DRAFT_2312341 [Mycena leptocephala]|nr:hypothetical protein B0H13DRAFT_2312341 [Mycena leptocephala]